MRACPGCGRPMAGQHRGRTPRCVDCRDRRRSDLPDIYPKGRRCTEPGCPTLLCMYNRGPYCYLHAAKHAAQVERQAEIDKSRMAKGQLREAIAMVA